MEKKEVAEKPISNPPKENETREVFLKSPLSHEKKGFQILTRMGFKLGDQTGSSEDSSLGLGHYEEAAERKKQRKQQDLFSAFKANCFQKTPDQLVISDYNEAQSTCENLDSRHSVTKPVFRWYWPKILKPNIVILEDGSSSDDEVEEGEVEKGSELETAKENLSYILTYLRNTYNYCMYCFTEYSSKKKMLQACPGASREEHKQD